MSVEGLDEEDQLFITLKASMHTALEEQATRVASLILTELQVAYPVSLFLLISFLFIRSRGRWCLPLPLWRL